MKGKSKGNNQICLILPIVFCVRVKKELLLSRLSISYLFIAPGVFFLTVYGQVLAILFAFWFLNSDKALSLSQGSQKIKSHTQVLAKIPCDEMAEVNSSHIHIKVDKLNKINVL